MQVEKAGNLYPNPNFQAKLVVSPKVLEYLIGKDYDIAQGKCLSLFDYQYPPLEQRRVLYNIFKHIKKDKSHKLIEINGGYWRDGDHKVCMKVDGKMNGRWRNFPENAIFSLRSNYIRNILNFAHQVYPSVNFDKKNIIKSFIQKLFGKNNTDYEFNYLAKKIEQLVVDEEISNKSIWTQIKDKLTLF